MTTNLENAGAFWGDLEVRQRPRGGREINGRFPYNKRAVTSSGGRRGRPEKEEILSRAFKFRIEDPKEEIHLLSGHRYDKPLATKLQGTLKIRDTADAVEFTAAISDEISEVTHVRDALALLKSGLAVGISPGFMMPPERAVPRSEAEEFVDEPINPSAGQHGAKIRQIKQALLFELSIVTRPVYIEANAELRAEDMAATPDLRTALRRWRL
ncbi:MAG: HK97 family phage prohead protease [Pseudomonadota bacterium]